MSININNQNKQSSFDEWFYQDVSNNIMTMNGSVTGTGTGTSVQNTIRGNDMIATIMDNELSSYINNSSNGTNAKNLGYTTNTATCFNNDRNQSLIDSNGEILFKIEEEDEEDNNNNNNNDEHFVNMSISPSTYSSTSSSASASSAASVATSASSVLSHDALNNSFLHSHKPFISSSNIKEEEEEEEEDDEDGEEDVEGTKKNSSSSGRRRKNSRKIMTQQQKEVHNKVEKKYRININTKIARLQKVIPWLDSPNVATTFEIHESEKDSPLSSTPTNNAKNNNSESHMRLNKSIILEKAVDYIMYLQNNEKLYELEVQKLKKELNALKTTEKRL